MPAEVPSCKTLLQCDRPIRQKALYTNVLKCCACYCRVEMEVYSSWQQIGPTRWAAVYYLAGVFRAPITQPSLSCCRRGTQPGVWHLQCHPPTSNCLRRYTGQSKSPCPWIEIFSVQGAIRVLEAKDHGHGQARSSEYRGVRNATKPWIAKFGYEHLAGLGAVH